MSTHRLILDDDTIEHLREDTRLAVEAGEPLHTSIGDFTAQLVEEPDGTWTAHSFIDGAWGGSSGANPCRCEAREEAAAFVVGTMLQHFM